MINSSDLIKTESYDENLKLYIEEGKEWMRRKYGFNSKWSLQMYAKFFYDQFFESNPKYNKLKYKEKNEINKETLGMRRTD